MLSHYHQDRICRHGTVLRYNEACPDCKREREQATGVYIMVRLGEHRTEVVAQANTVTELVRIWEQWQTERPTEEQYNIAHAETEAFVLHIAPELLD